MAASILAELLERNARHTDALSEDYFEAVQEGQYPEVVSVCCSDSRVAQEGMWDVRESGWLFTPSTIGNQVWDCHEDQRVVEGSVLYPMTYTETEVAVVVGHTGCGAVTAALEGVQRDGDAEDGGQDDGDATEHPPGVAKWIDLLEPVVADGLADDRVDPSREASLVDQLVEFNVDRQVAFLQTNDRVPDDVTVYGFVYDFQSVYGDVPGRAYLVNAEGETDAETLRSYVPDGFSTHVARLLDSR